MAYEVAWLKRAVRELERLPRDVQLRVRDAVDALAANPRPPGCKPLRGAWSGNLRIRVGAYRVVYTVDDSVRIVTIEHVGDRKDVY